MGAIAPDAQCIRKRGVVAKVVLWNYVYIYVKCLTQSVNQQSDKRAI